MGGKGGNGHTVSGAVCAEIAVIEGVAQRGDVGGLHVAHQAPGHVCGTRACAGVGK